MENKKVYLIGNSHIDPVWLWRWQEGFMEIKATFRSALDRMEEFPDFKFTCACTCYYEWIEKNEPAMFAEIKKRVREGRWILVGGWYIQPDCNMPSGESFARHSLYGQSYFKKHFGQIARVGYNVDSFGHNGTLPQILKKSGMNYYVFMRPWETEMHLPGNLFYWESADGSRVLTFRIVEEYCSRPPEPHDTDVSKERERLVNILQGANEANTDFMGFYGVGNHGGGATIKGIELIHKLQKEHPGAFVMSEPYEYFQHVEMEDYDIPTVLGELQHHAVGCYTAHAEIKKMNRKCEHAVLTAEKFNVLSKALLGTHYPQKRLTHAWKGIMFNHFHDIMGGACIEEGMRDSSYLHGEAMAIAERETNFALQSISWNIDTVGEHDFVRSKEKDWKAWEYKDLGTPVVVFNPLPFEVTSNILLNIEASYVTDNEGKLVPAQNTRARYSKFRNRYNTMFEATVPALGYRVYRAFMHREPKKTEMPFICTPDTMENSLVRVTFDYKTGYIKSFYDKIAKREILPGGGSVPRVIDEDDYDTFAHEKTAFQDEVGVFSGATLTLLEVGPLRAVMRVTSTYNDSTLTQDFILHANRADLEVHASIDFREKHKMVKLSFDLASPSVRTFCEVPFGTAQRATDGSEEPMQQWACLVNDENQGFTICNDSKYGYDVCGSKLSISVLRNPLYAELLFDRDGSGRYIETGLSDFAYTISAFHGFTDATRQAYVLNNPLRHVMETFHHGTLPCNFEGFRVSSDNVIVTALKLAEDEGGYVLRCYEANGENTEAVIDLPFVHRTIPVMLSHDEIKTLYIPLDDTLPIREVNLLEE